MIKYAITYIMIILGTIMIMFGFVILLERIIRRKKCTKSTYGRIDNISIHKDFNIPFGDSYYLMHDYGDNETHIPEYTYSVDGKLYTKKLWTVNYKFEYKIGQSITVWYNPKKPKQHYVEEEKINNLIMPIILIALGLTIPIWTFLLIERKG